MPIATMLPTLLGIAAAIVMLWVGMRNLGQEPGREDSRALLALRPARTASEGVLKVPNIIWILTDDQDQVLGGSFPPTSPGGATPMPKTKRLLSDAGIWAENWYIHVPICSPSRSTLLSGRYFHNIKQVAGPGAGMHVNYSKVNGDTFVRRLHSAGYTTGMFGKYLNVMPQTVPPGFDVWFANDGGDYFAPKFMVSGVEGLPEGWVKFSNAPSNYSTSVIGNMSVAFIEKAIDQGRPFMAYIAPKAAHEPFNPAPWYRDTWDPSWPEHEPRAENWNCSAASRQGHHGNIATEPLLTPDASSVITGVFKNRWRTLLSVDDLIAEVIGKVEELGQLDNTYVFFSSDHGFQLGQFNIPMDKRHVYEP
ncbi:GNS [Symbiodinium natans]|uniref:GNS protein n=1 Tax=Symbiodinium natans TaxID=878477 RepID=A0A812K5J9_9DINO|nr:GNS [Symbiodinium natans]